MKKRLIILIILTLTGSLFADTWHDRADEYWEKAKQLEKQYRYEESAEMCVKSAEAEKKSTNPRKAYLAIELNQAGYMYFAISRYNDALKYFKQALEIDRELGKKGNIAIRLNNIGVVYNSLGRYNDALKYYKQALKINRELGVKDGIAVDLNNIGMVYKSLGRYNEALKY